jgi:hypothetical protein
MSSARFPKIGLETAAPAALFVILLLLSPAVFAEEGSRFVSAPLEPAASEGSGRSSETGGAVPARDPFSGQTGAWAERSVRDPERVGYPDWETKRPYPLSNSYGSDRYHQAARQRLAAWQAGRKAAEKN